MARNYKQLECYKKAVTLGRLIMVFAETESSHRVKDQLKSSAMSISSNIAEGALQSSSKNYARFLSYALGSVAELETQLTILTTANNEKQVEEFLAECKSISVMLIGLLKVVNSWK